MATKQQLIAQQDIKALQRQLEGCTLDQVAWGTKRQDDATIIFGTSDQVTLDPAQLRELADAIEPFDFKLTIDRSGAKARLTISE